MKPTTSTLAALAIVIFAAGCHDDNDPNAPPAGPMATEDSSPSTAPNLVTGSHGGGAPFAVRLLLGPGKQNCSGVVLSKHWVMTAAHCVRGLPVHGNVTTVRAGDNATLATSDVFNGQASYYTHPEYSGKDSDLGDDFALILLYGGGMSSYASAKIMGESSAGYDVPGDIGYAWIAGYGTGTALEEGAGTCQVPGGVVMKTTGNFKVYLNHPAYLPNGPLTTWSPGSPFINEMKLEFGHHSPCHGDSGGAIYFTYPVQVFGFEVEADVVAGLVAGTEEDFFAHLHKGPSIRRRLDWIIAKTIEKQPRIYCTPGYSDVGPDYWTCTETPPLTPLPSGTLSDAAGRREG